MDEIEVTADDREMLAREVEAEMDPKWGGSLAEGARSGQLIGYRKAVLQAIARARAGKSVDGPDPKVRAARITLGQAQAMIELAVGHLA